MPARAESNAPKLPDRWAVERAAKAAPIPPIACHLVLVLCTYLDADSTRLPYRFSPSISGIVRATGWSRRTVTRWLEWLEAAGWLVRMRPTKHAQRTQHAKTAYSLLIPDLGPQGLVSRVTDSPGLGPQEPPARAADRPELGPDGPAARATAAHNQTFPDHQTEPDRDDREELEIVTRLIYEGTGVAIDVDHAARIRDLIVARPHKPGTRRMYIIRTLATAKDAEKWLKET